jgi:xanthine dehydrogenase accessory factor
MDFHSSSLVIPFPPMARDIYEEIVALRARGIPAALATIIARKGATPRKDSTKMLVYAGGRQFGTIGGGSIEADVFREALQILETGKPKLLTMDLSAVDPEENVLACGGSMEVYVEPILPDPTLFIFGAGHVSKAVAEVANLIGFKIAVIDDRPKYANPERFPHADAFYIDDLETSLQKLPVNEMSYLLIATRSHQFDLTCLRFAVQSQAKYIGMLGSNKKNKILLEQLEKEGIDPYRFDRISVPVGIDIGSETPEEIAISIAAELIAARKNQNILLLKEALRRAKSADALKVW